MKIDVSPAEVGVIVNSLQNLFSSGSPQIALADNLCDEVASYFDEIGFPDYYQMWLDEFEII